MNRQEERDQTATFFWDPATGEIDKAALAGVDAVVNLAGESLFGLWTHSKMRRIYDSRVRGTDLLSRALADVSPRPSVLVSFSASGFYGNRGDELLTEEDPPGTGFLAEVCRAWESAAQPAREAGIRVVHPRMSLVLSAGGGVLPVMLVPFRLGLGASFGGGRQFWSWISLTDAVAAIIHALDTPLVTGALNLAAPEVVTNREFTRKLARAVHRPALFHIPKWVARLAAGEMARSMILTSTRMVPAKLIASGFEFRYPTLDAALETTLAGPSIGL